ncbi:CAP domain-containing protein, partial [Leucosporidium creatinivorum]
LKSHNAARAEYGAGALTWDGDLVSLAQKWAKGCVWAHGGANGAGQNLAMFSGKDSTIDQAVDMWMNEAGDYDASNPIYSHFTQVVWEATTKLGCAVHYCPTIQGLSYGGNFFVCNYLSAGNVPGEFVRSVDLER